MPYPTRPGDERTTIRTATPADAAGVAAIYNHYVAQTVVTFEEEPVADGEMARRISEVIERLPWLVWDQGGAIAGYAYAAPWKPRSAYRFSVESTVYVSPGSTHRGSEHTCTRR